MSARVRCFGYLRVSGVSQVTGDGFPRQEAAISAHAKQNELEIVEFYRDEGISGAVESMDRPAWVKMLEAIIANGVRTIVIERLDRLARDLMVQEHIIKDLRGLGITLISAAEPDLCVSDPTRELVRHILGAISQYEKRMIVIKLKAAKERRRSAGAKTDGAYGYGCHPKRPDEAAVLAQMRAYRNNGLSLRAIAERLNADNVAPRRGLQWKENTLARILRRHPLLDGGGPKRLELS